MWQIIQPTRRSFRTLGHLLWVLLRGGWEMVVWGSVRAGSISLANTPRSFRLLIRFGLWITIGLLLMLLFGDIWRVASPLQPLVFQTDALAGIYAPQVFVPVAVGLLALAWTYLLSGALHAHWAAKFLVLVLFAIFDASFSLNVLVGLLSDIGLLLSGLGLSLWSALAVIVHIIVWPSLLAFFIFRWRRPIDLGLEFPLILLGVSAIFFSSYLGAQLSAGAFQSQATSGALQITQTLALIGTLLTPFLLIAGSEVAEFGLSLTHAVSSALGQNARLREAGGFRLWALALAAFLIIRLIAQWVLPLVTGADLDFSWGAVGVAAVLLGAFFLRARRLPRGEMPGWVVPASALALYGSLLLLDIVGFGASLLGILVVNAGASADFITGAFGALAGFIAEWNEVFVGGLALALGLVLWLRSRHQRRPLPPAALFAFIFFFWLLWFVLTRGGRPLEAFTFKYQDLDTIMTPALLGLLLIAALRRKLNPPAVLHLTAAAVLFWVLEFPDFLSDPLSPAFGLLGAQALLVSVSIFLNVMAAGNRFGLNAETERFPRMARSLLYFGYALLVVSTINWLSVSHSAGAMALNEQLTRNGFTAIGLPLAFWALITGAPNLLGAATAETTSAAPPPESAPEPDGA